MKTKERGVTLMEILIAIAIMVIMAALSIPTLSNFSESLSLRSASTRLSTMLKLAQRYAISYNAVYRVDISPQENWAAIYCGDTGGSIIGKSYHPPQPVLIATTTINGSGASNLLSQGSIKFYSKGTATPACYIHLVRSNSFFPNTKDSFDVPVGTPIRYYVSGYKYDAVSQEDKSKCHTLEVEANTGRVNLYKYGKGEPWE